MLILTDFGFHRHWSMVVLSKRDWMLWDISSLHRTSPGLFDYKLKADERSLAPIPNSNPNSLSVWVWVWDPRGINNSWFSFSWLHTYMYEIYKLFSTYFYMYERSYLPICLIIEKKSKTDTQNRSLNPNPNCSGLLYAWMNERSAYICLFFIACIPDHLSAVFATGDRLHARL